MSIHACEWAHERGCELRLSCPERVTLWQLARRAATKGFCWPSIVQLMFDTGLARQTVLTVVHALADHGLIRIEKEGQRFVYHLALPVQNKTGNRSNIRPDVGPNRSKSRPATGLKSSPNRSKNIPETGLDLDPNLKYNLKGNLKGADAGVREPENKISDSGKEATAPPPTPPPAAPVIGTTDGSAPPNADGFNDWLDRGAPADGSMHCATDSEEVTEDDTPKTDADREQMAARCRALIEELSGTKQAPTSMSSGGKLSMQAYPPGYNPVRDRWDQIEAYKPALPDVTLKAEQLAAARRIAMARVSA